MSQHHAVSYGGEAVFDGVMMKGATAWSLAVRLPDGEIRTEVHSLSRWMTKGRRWPCVRGLVALGTSVALGNKSLQASMRYREGSQPPPVSVLAKIGTTLGVFVVLGIFLLVPTVIAHLVPYVGQHAWLLSLFEAALRLTMIVFYITALGRNREVCEVFRYHSAEHATIAAREAGRPLVPDEVAKFPNAHPRCGTAFLLLIVLTGIVVHAVVGTHSASVLVLSRVVLLPIVAGITYELIRFASLHSDSVFGRIVAAPGIWLQRLTTREPTERHIEVAIAALNAVVAADEQVVSDAA